MPVFCINLERYEKYCNKEETYHLLIEMKEFRINRSSDYILICCQSF